MSLLTALRTKFRPHVLKILPQHHIIHDSLRDDSQQPKLYNVYFIHMYTTTGPNAPYNSKLRSCIPFLPSSTTSANYRSLHMTHHTDKWAAVAMGLGSIALTAKACQYAMSAWTSYQDSRTLESDTESSETTTHTNDTTQKNSTHKSRDSSSSSNTKTHSKPKTRQNIFFKLFNTNISYYEGGFEPVMTKSEAALILGVRQHSSSKTIRDAHRRLLVLNHPDVGGSTYVSGKINEAKDLLLKGRRGER